MSWQALDEPIRNVATTVLTPKQLDVWKLWLAGCSYRRISTMLEVGVPTVRGHLEAAHLRLEKAGVVRANGDPRKYHHREEAA